MHAASVVGEATVRVVVAGGSRQRSGVEAIGREEHSRPVHGTVRQVAAGVCATWVCAQRVDDAAGAQLKVDRG